MATLSSHIKEHGLLSLAAALCIGLSVPLSQIGISYTTILLAAASVCVVLHGDRSRSIRDAASLAKTPLALAIAVVFITWIPGILFSVDAAKSLQVWCRMIAYLCLGAMLWAYLRNNRSTLEVCQKALMVGCGVTLVLIAVNFLGGTEYIRALRFKPMVEGNPQQVMKHFALPALCLIPVVLFVGWRLGGAWLRSGFVIVAGFLLFIFLTRSAAAMAGLAFAALCVIILSLHHRRKFAPAVGFTSLALFIGAWFFWFSQNGVADYADAEALPVSQLLVDHHRQVIWTFVLSQIPDAIWTGFGIDAINKIPGAGETFRLHYNLMAEVLPSHPHSWALEILAETGVLGLTSFVVALGIAFVSLAHRFEDGTVPAIAGAALFGAYFGSSLFSVSFWASWWQLVFIVLWAVLAAMRRAGTGSGA